MNAGGLPKGVSAKVEELTSEYERIEDVLAFSQTGMSAGRNSMEWKSRRRDVP